MTEKIRQADRSGAITASTLEGRSVLKLQKTVQDTAYITWLYEDEGYLKELMVREDTPLSLSAGLLQITIHTADGDDCSLSVSLKADPYVSPAENEEGGAANEQ